MDTSRERSRYREFLPPRPLSDRLLCLWTQHIDSRGGDYHQPVLPDGCVDIVWIGNAAPIVAGPATRRVIVELPAGTNVVGARFRPGWAGGSLGVPADRLLDQDVPLVDVWNRGAGPFADLMNRYRSTPARLAGVSAALAVRLVDSREADPAIRTAVPWLVRHPAGHVGELARLLGLSRRQFQRRFHAAVGYGPKVFQRIMRFQRLLAVASACRDPADLAATVGYADQAHMCREVRAFAGQASRGLLGHAGTTLSMSDLFNTDNV